MYSVCLDNLEKKEVLVPLVQSYKRATQRYPCGYLTDPLHECSCSPVAIQRYMAKVSGLILDRIDIHVEVPSVKYRDLADKSESGETSQDICKRVNRSREIQKLRACKEFCVNVKKELY